MEASGEGHIVDKWRRRFGPQIRLTSRLQVLITTVGSGKSVLSSSICQSFMNAREDTDDVFLYAFFQDPSTAAREHRRKRQEASDTIPSEEFNNETNSAKRIVASLV